MYYGTAYIGAQVPKNYWGILKEALSPDVAGRSRTPSTITTSIDDANSGDDDEGDASMAGNHKHIPRNQPEDKCHSPACRNCRRTRARRRRSSEGFARMRQSWRPRSRPMPEQEL
jgi:hypothetical protein